MSGPDKDEWLDAVYSEIRSLIINDIFDIVSKPNDRRIIKCRTILRNKYDANGALNRRKARVVAKGYAQRPGINFFETYAPIARLGSLRLLMALTTKFNLRVSQLDIETAYLNGKIDTDVFMDLPDLLHGMLKRMTHQKQDAEILRRASPF